MEMPNIKCQIEAKELTIEVYTGLYADAIKESNMTLMVLSCDRLKHIGAELIALRASLNSGEVL